MNQYDKDGSDPTTDEKSVTQDRMEAIEGIKRGLESMKRNNGKTAEEFFHDFFAEKGISEYE